MKPTLTICQGLQASGKTTWALEQVAKAKRPTCRVNRDQLREMTLVGTWTGKKEKRITVARDALIRGWLAKDWDVICDDTNLDDTVVAHLKAIADECGATWRIKSFDVPLEVCVARDASRAHPVGERVLRTTWERYLKPRFPVPDESLPAAIIVDMDGTLSLLGGRDPYNEATCHLDPPNRPILELVLAWFGRAEDCALIVMSGRDEGRGRTGTEAWLKEHLSIGADEFQLFMRAAGDQRKDSVVKRELYEEHVAGKYRVLFVVDDRESVVRMWRDELGLTCIQVNDGWF